MITTEEITDDARAYRHLLSACAGWGFDKQDVFALLDTGEAWPASMPPPPSCIFERVEAEKSHDYMTSDMARRERRQRAARLILRVVAEQSRCEDMNAAAETLARLLARGKTRSQSRSEARVRPDGRLRRPDARQAG